jgi:flagellar motor switch protein FliG
MREAHSTASVSGDAAAAIMLTLLGEAEAAAILGALNPDEARRLGVAMLDVAQAQPADIDAALTMFVGRIRTTSTLGLDAAPRVRSVFNAALGTVRADSILTEIAPHGTDRLVDKLRWMPGDAIATAIASEPRQVGAVILTCLSAERAAEALAQFDDEHQSDLIFRAASLDSITAAALADLDHVLDRYVETGKRGQSVKIGGRAEAARIVTKLPKGTDQRVLKALKKRDRVLAQNIEDDMFVFDDLAALDGKAMSTLLRAVDTQVLTLALRGAKPAMIDTMLGCLSARAAQTIRDDMAEAAPTKRADVEAAQKEIAGLARHMADAGDLNLGGHSNDYV